MECVLQFNLVLDEDVKVECDLVTVVIRRLVLLQE